MGYSGSTVIPMQKKNTELTLSKNEEVKDEGKKRESAREINRWFMGFTSIGGLSQINASESKVSKIFWLILFLVGVIATIWNVQQILVQFFKFDVSKKKKECKGRNLNP